MSWVRYALLGTVFGVVLTKSEVISWFRIQEMFRFQSFHMYGIIGAAVATGALSVFVIKKLGLKSRTGEPMELAPKVLGSGVRYALGGTIFGLGWGLAGACPGPIFALIGNGFVVVGVVLLSALLGTRTYAALRTRLPH